MDAAAAQEGLALMPGHGPGLAAGDAPQGGQRQQQGPLGGVGGGALLQNAPRRCAGAFVGGGERGVEVGGGADAVPCRGLPRARQGSNPNPRNDGVLLAANRRDAGSVMALLENGHP
ncbi:hypothetical protein GCM10010276_89800 [Streptomyces longisporus]|uniref:Uncharacterized protein n=1 Tax=Streptomyces longisporus TaxID=1948 RepID=A0ABN3NJZ6_STRLO